MAGLVRLVIGTVVAAATMAIGCSKTPEPDAIALHWLDRSCNVGERGRAETALRRGGEPAENALISAFRRGPAPRRLDEIAAEAESDYNEVAEALNAGRSYGLSARQIDAIRAVSRAEYVRSAREEFARGYRDAALAGLGVLRLPRGIALLREVAADSNSPDRPIALKALRVASQPAQP